MNRNKFAKAADLNRIGTYLTDLAHDHTGHHHSMESTREEQYKNHRIIIQTIYRVEVDGKELTIPLGVDNTGNLHCHSLPNYQFASAIDMLKILIDQYPDDFKSTSKVKKKVKMHQHKKTPNKKATKGRK